MNIQEIFNVSAVHLLKQGKKSKASGGYCKYRGPNGLMCAIGCLIPNDVYDPKMDNGGGVSAWSLLKYYPKFQGHMDASPQGDKATLMSRLQSIHDAVHARSWRKRLVALAEELNLSAEAIS